MNVVGGLYPVDSVISQSQRSRHAYMRRYVSRFSARINAIFNDEIVDANTLKN